MKVFLFLLLILACFQGAAPSRADAGRANIFIYHRFGESRYPSTNISLEDFAAQLDILQREKVPVLPLSEVVGRLRDGRELPEHCAVLTVDDGYRSFLTGAMPLLRRYNFPVTLFVNTDAVGGRNYLSWKDLQALEREGVAIGHHTASHLHMIDHRPGESELAWRQRLRDDLARASAAFSTHLEKRPRIFAYPYGEYSSVVEDLVRQAGFTAAVAQQSGVVSAGTDLFALPRFPMGGPYASPRQFRQKLRMFSLPVEVLSPSGPLLDEGNNPPLLEFRLAGDLVDPRRLQCYVPGQPPAEIQAVPGTQDRFRVRAGLPLAGRRSKYTLTAPLRKGGWAWFSYLWIRPSVPEGGY
ncbi:polysaccharide deacetylase family protein [Geothermobacter hydrogeniphilus]|uniref:NodB homology domain-containing protein n=1 Tax=Geothermobacter hydrogeniphilus TaxID=1969733 RepID=A0A1X0YEZ1_9BACT|nr:polysaccharide deacetylase family protein [Geothermobacter hydrogeniphilus]ORJ63554.1 hypothetical protein B5V00_01415 [Geothermobacter hydrogeniphilus]